MIVETVMEVVDKGMGLLRAAMFKAFSSGKPNTGKNFSTLKIMLHFSYSL